MRIYGMAALKTRFSLTRVRVVVTALKIRRPSRQAYVKESVPLMFRFRSYRDKSHSALKLALRPCNLCSCRIARDYRWIAASKQRVRRNLPSFARHQVGQAATRREPTWAEMTPNGWQSLKKPKAQSGPWTSSVSRNQNTCNLFNMVHCMRFPQKNTSLKEIGVNISSTEIVFFSLLFPIWRTRRKAKNKRKPAKQVYI